MKGPNIRRSLLPASYEPQPHGGRACSVRQPYLRWGWRPPADLLPVHSTPLHSMALAAGLAGSPRSLARTSSYSIESALLAPIASLKFNSSQVNYSMRAQLHSIESSVCLSVHSSSSVRRSTCKTAAAAPLQVIGGRGRRAVHPSVPPCVCPSLTGAPKPIAYSLLALRRHGRPRIGGGGDGDGGGREGGRGNRHPYVRLSVCPSVFLLLAPDFNLLAHSIPHSTRLSSAQAARSRSLARSLLATARPAPTRSSLATRSLALPPPSRPPLSSASSLRYRTLARSFGLPSFFRPFLSSRLVSSRLVSSRRHCTSSNERPPLDRARQSSERTALPPLRRAAPCASSRHSTVDKSTWPSPSVGPRSFLPPVPSPLVVVRPAPLGPLHLHGSTSLLPFSLSASRRRRPRPPSALPSLCSYALLSSSSSMPSLPFPSLPFPSLSSLAFCHVDSLARSHLMHSAIHSRSPSHLGRVRERAGACGRSVLPSPGGSGRRVDVDDERNLSLFLSLSHTQTHILLEPFPTASETLAHGMDDGMAMQPTTCAPTDRDRQSANASVVAGSRDRRTVRLLLDRPTEGSLPPSLLSVLPPVRPVRSLSIRAEAEARYRLASRISLENGNTQVKD